MARHLARTIQVKARQSAARTSRDRGNCDQHGDAIVADPADLYSTRPDVTPDSVDLDPAHALLLDLPMSNGKRIAYILKNNVRPPRYYVGLAADLRVRLVNHNAAAVLTPRLGGRGMERGREVR